MPNGFKLPELPAGAKWGFADDPSNAPSPEDAQDNLNQSVGSVYREVAGPQQPPEMPSFLSGVLKPTAEKAAALIPHTPFDIGMMVASGILAGPGGPAARIAAKVLPEAVPAMEAIGATGVRRLLGMGAAGAAMGGPSGALSGVGMQLGGEVLSKLSKYGLMNAQAKALAKEDPETLGKIVTPIIQGLGEIKTPNDFHAAFNNNGAQLVASQAYRQGMDEISAIVGQQPIRSSLMTQMRRAGATPNPGSVTMTGGIPGAPASMPGAIGQPSAEYSFEDATNTLKRLRRDGWNQDEIRSGLGAMDSREAADKLATEIKTQIPPDAAEKFSTNDGQYARSQALIQAISDPRLLKKDGELNIPRLQEKFKADGYPARQSMQMTADAMALKDAIFRGSDQMAEDVPGQAGKVFDHFRLHFGVLPTFYPSLPKLGTYAGRQNWGLDPFGGTQVGQLLKRGMSKPNTLAADSSE